jgi:hypothetical protein
VALDDLGWEKVVVCVNIVNLPDIDIGVKGDREIFITTNRQS